MRRFLDKENLFLGLRLALVATLGTSVYHAYDYLVVQRAYAEARLGGGALAPRFALDIVMMFVALFISATAGYAWARGGGLAGFGTWRRVRRDLVLIVPLGAAVALLSVFVLEPQLYTPVLAKVRNPFKPLSVVFFEEIVCRWGILAIAFRLSRSVAAAVVASAVFNVFATLPVLQMHAGALETWRLATIVSVKFVLALGYALFYVRKGLLSTMALRFVAALPAPVLAVLG